MFFLKYCRATCVTLYSHDVSHDSYKGFREVMCAISGLIHPGLAPEQMCEQVESMAQVMRHRGPDGYGAWVSSRRDCALSHRRLSIIDLSEDGKQPMLSADGQYALTFNGEIYNYKELKKELEAEGVQFRTRTDTEVLMMALIQWGRAALQKLDGMYAFAFYDARERRLLLVRDPFGEKPLYYIRDNNFFAFASELTALQVLPGFDSRITSDALADYLYFQYVGAPESLYEQVKKLPPGSWLEINTDLSGWHTGRHFEFLKSNKTTVEDRLLSKSEENDLADELEEILVASIRRRLHSDVPMGLFLSGGVDSNTILALLRKRLGVEVDTFTVGFKGNQQSEHELAKESAQRFGSRHHEQILDEAELDSVEMLGSILDEPNADTSCLPTYLLCRMAKPKITVALSGDGADELFGGYERYGIALSGLKSGREKNPGRKYLDRLAIHHWENILQMFGDVPQEFRGRLEHAGDILKNCHLRWIDRLRKSDVENYLPGAVLAKMDRMSMQHGLEVRTPFLTREMAAFAARVPEGLLYQKERGKRILRKVAERYIPKEFLNRRKEGFGVGKNENYQRRLGAKALALVEDPHSKLCGHMNGNLLRKYVRQGIEDRSLKVSQAWSLIVLEHYLRTRPSQLASEFPTFDKVHTAHLVEAATRNSPAAILHNGKEPTWAKALPGGNRIIQKDPSDVTKNMLNAHEVSGTLLLLYGLDELTPEFFDLVRKSSFLSLNVIRPQRVVEVVVSQQNEKNQNGWDDKWGDLIFPLQKRIIKLLTRKFPYRPLMSYLQKNSDQDSAGRTVLEDPSDSRQAYARNPWSKANQGRRYKSDGLFSYRVRISELASSHVEKNSECIIFEKNWPLPLPGALHTNVRLKGRGRHCRKGNFAYFSTSDNSNPNFNGETYRYCFKGTWAWKFIQWAIGLEHGEPFFLRSNLSKLGARSAKTRVEIPAYRDDFSNKLGKTISKFPAIYAGVQARQKHRVILFTSHLKSGGAERQLCNLARQLKTCGIHPSVLTMEHEASRNHYLELLSKMGIPRATSYVPYRNFSWQHFFELPIQKRECFFILPEKLKALVWNTFTHLAEEPPEVIHCFLDRPNITGALAAWFAGVPRIVLSMRGANPTEFEDQKNWDEIYRSCYRVLADQKQIIFTANSAEGIRDYATWLGIPVSRFYLTRNIVDTEEFIPRNDVGRIKTRKQLGINTGQPMIVSAFRMSHEKAPRRFLEVVALVAKTVPDLKVVVCGEGKLTEQFQKDIIALKLKHTVIHLGRRNDVGDIIGAGDLLLLASDSEGTPNVVLEAQSMEVPVVATDVGGTSESLQNGRTGFLKDRNDVNGLGERCVTLLQDVSLRRKFAIEGRKFVVENYSAQHAMKNLLPLYGIDQ